MERQPAEAQPERETADPTIAETPVEPDFRDGAQLPFASPFAGELLNEWRLSPLRFGEGEKFPLRLQFVRFSPDGRHVAALIEPNVVQIVDTVTWAAVGSTGSNDAGHAGARLEHQGRVLDATFSPGGELLVTGSGEYDDEGDDLVHRGRVRFWRTDTGEPAGEPLEFDFRVRRVVYSPDGECLAASAGNWDPVRFITESMRPITRYPETEAVHILDAETLTPLFDPLPHVGEIDVVQFSKDSRILLTAGTSDQQARLWDVRSGELIGEPFEHAGGITAAALSLDGEILVTASCKSLHVPIWEGVQIWDVSSHSVIASPIQADEVQPLSLGISRVAISPNGDRMATGEMSNLVGLWRLPEGEPVGELTEHNLMVAAVVFSPDGRLLLTAGSNGTAQFWSAEDGRAIGPPLQQPGQNRVAITAAGFSPDGRKVLIVGSGGMCLWNVP